MKRKHKVIIAAIVCILAVFAAAAAGCAGNPATTTGTAPETVSSGETAAEVNTPDTGDDKESHAAAVKANEAGKVMILMYHVIGAPAEAPWMQTAENLRRDLNLLYQQGYRLISLHDFIRNDIKTPAGRTPLILTFDDATAGHFRYLVREDGTKEIDHSCAVGILLEFGEEHPDFGHTATFYIYDRPFGQREYWQEKLQELVKLGFDIGNHTLTHAKLNKLPDGEVQRELAELARLVEQTVPGYRVRSLALPYGLSPRNSLLAAEGSYKGWEYRHEAVLKVGANPAQSPISAGFDPLALPRVQASTEELGKWLAYFQKNPGERYVSDGDPLTVAVPREKEALVDPGRIKDKKLIIWGS